MKSRGYYWSILLTVQKITELLDRQFSRNKQVHITPSSLSWGRTDEEYEVHTGGNRGVFYKLTNRSILPAVTF